MDKMVITTKFGFGSRLCEGKVYSYLVERTDSKFNDDLLEHLMMIKDKQPPMSLERLIDSLKEKEEGKIAVVLGVVTDDLSVYHVPAIKVTALKFTDTARARIETAGGECLTFGHLFYTDILGFNSVLVKE